MIARMATFAYTVEYSPRVRFAFCTGCTLPVSRSAYVDHAFVLFPAIGLVIKTFSRVCRLSNTNRLTEDDFADHRMRFYHV
jgi:hypothetical protein